MKKGVLILLLSGLIINLSALEWPVRDPRVLDGFGGVEHGVLSPYIRIAGADSRVTAIADGTVVFVQTQTQLLPYVILEHSNSLRSLYRNLEPVVAVGDTVAQGELLGYAETVDLQIIDNKSFSVVNPEFLLPLLPDQSAPYLAQAVLEQNGGKQDLQESTSCPEGRSRLMLTVFDRRGSVQLRPFELQVFLDGLLQREIRFDTLDFRDTEFMFKTARTPADLYADMPDRNTFIVENLLLLPGEHLLEIQFSDISGNRSSAEFILQVSRR